MVVSMKMTVFWDVAPCSLDESLIALLMEAASTSEMLVNFYQTTQCNIPEDSHLQKIDCFVFILFVYLLTFEFCTMFSLSNVQVISFQQHKISVL
jgi:hypothetical protein